MEELGLFNDQIDKDTSVMFINFGKEEAVECLPIIQKLRKVGIISEIYPDSTKIKKQMTYANNKSFDYVVMIGEDEIKTGLISVKDMSNGLQENVTINDFIKKLN